MSVTLGAALFLQAVGLMLLRHRLGRGWLRRPGTLIFLASVVYNGVSPVLLTVPYVRNQDLYHAGLQQRYIDSATLVMSAGMLAFLAAYLLTCPERAMTRASPEDIRVAISALDWRWLACVLAPLAVLTYEGRGYNNAQAIGPGSSLGSDLASMFFIVLVALTAFSFLLRYSIRWFLPVLVAQSLVLAAAGERTPVVMDAIALILLLAYAEVRPSGRQLRVALALTVLAILAITGVRADKGRVLYYTNTGLGTRVAALGSGLNALSGQGSNLVTQAALRLDGVDFAGAVLQAQALGEPRLSAMYVPESLLILVPSVIWPAKLANANLNPTLTELQHFGLKQVNFLPGFTGIYSGFLSPPWMALFLAFGGMLCGCGERKLYRRCTPARLVLLAGSVNCALGYEQGLPGMLTALRAAIVIAGVVKLIEAVRTRRSFRLGKRSSAQWQRRSVRLANELPALIND